VIAERAVRPHGVVVNAPSFDQRGRVSQIQEPVLVQTLVTKLPVEALDERVLDRPARFDELQANAALVRPGEERQIA
jgi:hypothetical protein